MSTTALAIVERFSPADTAAMLNTVAKGCSDAEFAMLLRLANLYGLDPFLKEIWAAKPKDGGPALIMVARDGYLKAAQRDPAFMGLQAAVVKKGDSFAFDPSSGAISHAFGAERGAILGAWAVAHRRDRMPVACFVDFSEYRGEGKVWIKYPSAMIQKVAEVFALKRQFGINGLVSKEEMDCEGAPEAPIQRSVVSQEPSIVSVTPLTVAPAPSIVDADTGEEYEPEDDVPFAWSPNEQDLTRIYAIAQANGMEGKEDLRAWFATIPGYPPKEGQLTRTQFDEVCNHRLPAYGEFLIATREQAKGVAEASPTQAVAPVFVSGCAVLVRWADSEDAMPGVFQSWQNSAHTLAKVRLEDGTSSDIPTTNLSLLAS